MKRTQYGSTLVELMVAMLIGLVLTLAALQLFFTNQRTFALQQAVAELNEDGQMAIRYMVADIRQAGRGSAIAGSIPPVVLDSTADGNTGSDTLALNYWGTTPCADADYPAEDEVQNVYSVAGGVLQCTNALTGSTIDLLTGVESFQVLYGLDGDRNGSLGVTNFVTASDLDADSVIVAIRFALLLSSDRFSLGQIGNTTHWVLDQEVSTNDSDLRRVFTSTVQLRNYNWDAI
ncbi:MAG: prepilin-type cleavage/methylation domain-containing protein [Gammaproteobacteria bacterium]|nr:prepilin-type cleavage/methylation domain-containing protein [Gammaproteobacteria bacterium]